MNNKGLKYSLVFMWPLYLQNYSLLNENKNWNIAEVIGYEKVHNTP